MPIRRAPAGVLLSPEQQLEELLRATAEVIDGELGLDEGLQRLSRAVCEAIPHDWLDVGWVEDGGTGFRTLQAIAALPDEERPGELLRIDGSGLEPVLLHGQALALPDRDGLPAHWGAATGPTHASAFRAYLVVPLRLGHRVSGFLEFSSRRPAAYGPEVAAFAQAAADRIAPIVETLHLYRTEQVARRQLETVMAISRAISASLDLDEILTVIGRSLTQTLNLPTCAIYLVDEERRALVPRAAFGDKQPPVVDPAALDAAFHRTSFPLDRPADCPLGAIREPYVIERPQDYAAFSAEFLRDVPMASVLKVPFVVRDRLVGMAALPIWVAGRGFSRHQLDLAMGIAQSAAVAIEHGRLFGQARELGMAEERNRLAREVHDTLAQGLTTLIHQLETIQHLLPDGLDAGPLVAEAHQLARASLAEARRAVWKLAPASLDGRSLPEALADQVAAFARRTGLDATFAQRGGEPDLDDTAAGALVRVLQEALHNVEKHAGAGRVRVELEQQAEPGHCSMLVADDGRGFSPQDAPTAPGAGFGLTSMRERIASVGGTLEVDSALAWGTRVIARLAAAPAPAAPAPETLLERDGPARVLLVDDHPLAREGLRQLLADRADVAVMAEATDGDEAVERALALRPDVVLMDLQLPRRSGLDATRAIREDWPEARVLILSSFAGEDSLFAALQAGARGYLPKDADAEELAAAIRTLHSGGSMIRPDMAAHLVDRFGELAERERLPEPLTERELEVLGLAAAGLRNRDIADRLVVTEKTVKFHLTQVYAKLQASGRADAIVRAREFGLL